MFEIVNECDVTNRQMVLRQRKSVSRVGGPLSTAVTREQNLVKRVFAYPIGFCVTGADLGVFVARKGKHILILAAHVDNRITTGSSPELIQDFKQKLNNCYTPTDLGVSQWAQGVCQHIAVV